MTDALVEIAVVNDPALAEILKGRLRSEGLDARLFDAGFSGLLGGAFPGIRLMVPAADADTARTLLDLP
ncbi:putative signal transducing protein [Sandaracinobacteroides sp. A072]|uniref:putative signal transducing protein n=1 Tax=Sandaracinobacteroides sp. A072 TaxID=3461146 RepID=UPI004042F696